MGPGPGAGTVWPYGLRTPHSSRSLQLINKKTSCVGTCGAEPGSYCITNSIKVINGSDPWLGPSVGQRKELRPRRGEGTRNRERCKNLVTSPTWKQRNYGRVYDLTGAL